MKKQIADEYDHAHSKVWHFKSVFKSFVTLEEIRYNAPGFMCELPFFHDCVRPHPKEVTEMTG